MIGHTSEELIVVFSVSTCDKDNSIREMGKKEEAKPATVILGRPGLLLAMNVIRRKQCVHWNCWCSECWQIFTIQ